MINTKTQSAIGYQMTEGHILESAKKQAERFNNLSDFDKVRYLRGELK